MQDRVASPGIETHGSHSRGVRIGLLTLLVAYFIWNSLYFWPFVVDDTFISLRYARNLIDGHGLVYNRGERVEGYSNFSWVMISAGLMALGVPVVTALKLLGLLCGVGAILLTCDLCRTLFDGRSESTLSSIVAMGFLGLNTSFAIWTQGGLETEFFALVLVAMAWAFEREIRRNKPFVLSSVLFVLAWLTRPEAPIYGLYLLVRRVIVLRARPVDRRDMIAFGFAASTISAYEVWGVWYFGRLLPNTHLAKVGAVEVGGFAEKLSGLVHQPLLASFLGGQGLGWVFLVLICLAGLCIRFKSIPCVAWLPTACGLFFVFYAQDDWMPRYRLFVPILPLLAVLVGHGIGEVVARARRLDGGRVILTLVVLAAGMGYLHHQFFGGHANRLGYFLGMGRAPRGWWIFDVPGNVGQREYPLERTALMMLQNLPENETMALRDLGFPGYLCMNPVWDTAGLMTPSVARARHDSSPEASRAMHEDLLQVRPGCIYLIIPIKVSDLTLGGPVNSQLDKWLQEDKRARELYERQVGTEGSVSVVTYWRRDLPPVDAALRLADARSRLPEYNPQPALVEKTRGVRDAP